MTNETARTQGSSKIKGASVILQPMSQEFVTPTYLAWLNDPEITRFLSSRNQSLIDLENYVRERESNPNVRFWAVCDSKTGLHIGNVKLEPIDWTTRTAVFGILVGDKNYWGKGIATEVTSLVVRHAFDALGIKRVELGVEEENSAALRAYERAGFRTEKHVKYDRPASNGSAGKYVMAVERS